MLDTNTVSYLLRDHPAVTRRVVGTPLASLCMSAITEGELLFGLARRPEARRLHAAVRERYGVLRADLERRGRSLAPLDLLIAAHALNAEAVLATNDRTFGQVADLDVEDWTN
jgi:tRNA(fMet)-specific endonuclease VapC